MTWRFVESEIGIQPMTTTSTTQLHPLGKIVRAKDETLGMGEFIYLQGIASTIVGSVVTYSAAFVTALAAVGGNKAQPVAIAMSANVASQYGWYQISGNATVAKACTVSLAAGAAVGVLTAGFIAATGTAKEVQGALVAAVASATAGRTTVTVMLDRPHMQGRIT